MSEADLRQINQIPPRMLVKAGSTLLVPRNGPRSQDVAEHIGGLRRLSDIVASLEAARLATGQ